MKKFLQLGIVVGLLTVLPACSKKSEAVTEAPAPDTTTAAPAPPANPAAAAAVQSLPQVSQAIQGGQYENAVQTLVQMQPATAQMTDAQRLQYQQAVREATTALLGAKDRDPAAKAAYDKLSRSATGR